MNEKASLTRLIPDIYLTGDTDSMGILQGSLDGTLEALRGNVVDWTTLDLRIFRDSHTDPATGRLARDGYLTLRATVLTKEAGDDAPDA